MELKLAGKKFDFFNSFTLDLKYDAVASAFAFSVYFNPDDAEHKTLMRPGGYKVAEVWHNDELLVKGYVLSHTFNHSAQKQLASLAGYSTPGVLEDCEIPVSLYPLQSDGLTLKEIAQKLIKPFGIKMVIDAAVSAAMDKQYDVSNAKETQTVKQYLTELAAQKNIVLSHTAAGSLLFTKAKTNLNPILDFNGSGIPSTSMSLSFSGQQMHSTITVIKEADAEGGNAGESPVSNPFVSLYRPKVVVQSSGTDIDTSQAAKTALADELKNIKLTITTDRWEVDGKILKPNNIITVTNPELFLYKKTRWFIESISFAGDNKSNTATLTCVLPSVYDDSTPTNIFA